MKWNRFCRFFYFLACGGLLLQTAGCDATSLLGNLATQLIISMLLGGIST